MDVLHCVFVDVEPRRQQELSKLIFCEPRSWLNDRYRPDRVLLSAWTVLVAPLTAYRGEPGRFLSWILNREEMQPVVPDRLQLVCRHCRVPLSADKKICGGCGVPVVEPLSTLTPMPRAAARHGLGTTLAPSLLAAAALALAIGWAPTTQTLSLWIPLDAPDQVEHEGDMGDAYFLLANLRRELGESAAGMSPHATDWSERLASATDWPTERVRQTGPCGNHLLQAGRALASAAFELEHGEPVHRVHARLSSVDRSLAHAWASLEGHR
jgi:hypothetical protein